MCSINVPGWEYISTLEGGGKPSMEDSSPQQDVPLTAPCQIPGNHCHGPGGVGRGGETAWHILRTQSWEIVVIVAGEYNGGGGQSLQRQQAACPRAHRPSRNLRLTASVPKIQSHLAPASEVLVFFLELMIKHKWN